MNKLEDKYIGRKHKLFSSEHFEITEKFIRKNFVFPLHWHDHYEIEVILSGKGNHTFNNNDYDLFRGEAFLLTHFDSHRIVSFEDMYVITLRFDEDVIPESIIEFFSWRNGFTCSLNNDELNLIEEKINELKSIAKEDLFYNEHIKNIITSIMLIMLKNMPDNTSTPPTLAQKTIAYVTDHFREDISLESVAKFLSITPKHLGVVFKNSAKMSFHTYLNATRLKYACSLLTSTDKSVKEVAYSSGYNSLEHFIYTFKKYFSVSPAAYRKAYSDKGNFFTPTMFEL